MDLTAHGIYFVAFVIARTRHRSELRNLVLHWIVQRNIALWELDQVMGHTAKVLEDFAAVLGDVDAAERAEFDGIASHYDDEAQHENGP